MGERESAACGGTFHNSSTGSRLTYGHKYDDKLANGEEERCKLYYQFLSLVLNGLVKQLQTELSTLGRWTGQSKGL